MRSLVWLVVAVAGVVACGDSPAASTRRAVATLVIVAQPAGSLAVATNVGPFSVRATDSSNTPVPGAYVSFMLARGSGRVTVVADTTDASGIAKTDIILGSAPGPHIARASTRGLPPVESGIVTGIPGAVARISLSASLVTISAGQDSSIHLAATLDAQGNTTNSIIAWNSRNPAAVSVTPNNTPGTSATLRALTRPGETWVVATAASVRDSVLVRVLAAGASPCAFVASPTQMAVGAMLPFHNAGAACLNTPTSAEYVVVAHYGSPVNTTSATINLLGTGIVAPTAVYPGVAGLTASQAELSFERELRDRERASVGAHLDGARAWRRGRPAALRASLREGDQLRVNTNSSDFCANPSSTLARVVAITETSVILEDTENPAGGFTEAEYRAIGATIDTLAHPAVTAAFGAPTDIDGNGRMVVLFTRAVNAITPRGSAGVVLGFFFSRDLLPQTSASGGCPGSNVGEMFYILVPDPNAVVSDARTKTFVANIAAATIAHELQHLINASRRIYLNSAPDASEEIWLNEGLSHIAEELLFYRASKLSPRQNLDSNTIKASGQRAMLDLYQQNNFRRFEAYLRAPDSNAPMADNDLLATRGAAWAFLRYLADRSRATDGDLWRRLVDSRVTGARNLDDALQGSGFTTLSLLEEWSRAVVGDDIIPGAAAQQPSWSFVTAMPLSGYPFALVPSALQNGITFSIPVRGSSSFYGRFAAAAGQDALIQATGPGGGTIPPGMRLTLIRIK